MSSHKHNMDSVALYLSAEDTQGIILALREMREKCEAEEKLLLALKYQELERIMTEQMKVAMSIRSGLKKNLD